MSDRRLTYELGIIAWDEYGEKVAEIHTGPAFKERLEDSGVVAISRIVDRVYESEGEWE